MLKEMSTTYDKLQAFEDQCNHILDTLDRQVINMEKTNKYLFPENIGRSKIAPLEFIGSLHILFETIDAEDGKAMVPNMKNMLNNQHNLKYLRTSKHQ